jgi:arylsulfatase A-like enzyme
MKYLEFVLAAIGCFATSSLSFGAQPNIILFYTDDHGYADLGIQGYEKDLKTPNLDALARSGVLAKHGYSTAPQCVPSRGGLMTGKFQGRFNLDNNGSSLDGFNKETTIATRLRNVGYVTAQFGKWHLGPTEDILKHGFQHSFSQNAQRPFSSNITLDGQDRPMGTLPPEAYHIDGCSRAAAAIIKRFKDKPLFLYVAYRAPHTPLDAPQKFLDRFPGTMPTRRRAALGMLSAIDDGVGLITDTIKECGLTEKTLFFFIGDNGAPLKIHKVDSPLDGDAGGWDGSLNTPLNGEKGMLSEGGMHVPFLIAWPGTIPAGQIYDHPISSLDVAATAAAVASIEVKPNDLDGVNLIPHLKGENTEPPHDALYWRWTAQSAIREGNWKLLRGGEREYLYDLSDDLEEKHNLASKHPEISKRLRAKLNDWGQQLNPAGLALSPMAETWNNYFDFYLEGKEAGALGSKKGGKSSASPTQDWTARNGTMEKRDGLLKLTPEKGKSLFITRSQMELRAPVTVELTLKAPRSGQASVSWRVDGDKEFLPENRVSFSAKGSDEWQTHKIVLPAEKTVIHIRVYLPDGAEWIREIKLGASATRN